MQSRYNNLPKDANDMALALFRRSADVLKRTDVNTLSPSQKQIAQENAFKPVSDLYNKVTNYIKLSIITKETFVSGEEAVKYWLVVLKQSLKNKDYNSAAQIHDALKASAVYGLYDEIIDGNKQIKKIAALLSNQNNYKNIQDKYKELRKKEKFFIPVYRIYQDFSTKHRESLKNKKEEFANFESSALYVTDLTKKSTQLANNKIYQKADSESVIAVEIIDYDLELQKLIRQGDDFITKFEKYRVEKIKENKDIQVEYEALLLDFIKEKAYREVYKELEVKYQQFEKGTQLDLYKKNYKSVVDKIKELKGILKSPDLKDEVYGVIVDYLNIFKSYKKELDRKDFKGQFQLKLDSLKKYMGLRDGGQFKDDFDKEIENLIQKNKNGQLDLGDICNLKEKFLSVPVSVKADIEFLNNLPNPFPNDFNNEQKNQLKKILEKYKLGEEITASSIAQIKMPIVSSVKNAEKFSKPPTEKPPKPPNSSPATGSPSESSPKPVYVEKHFEEYEVGEEGIEELIQSQEAIDQDGLQSMLEKLDQAEALIKKLFEVNVFSDFNNKNRENLGKCLDVLEATLPISKLTKKNQEDFKFLDQLYRDSTHTEEGFYQKVIGHKKRVDGILTDIFFELAVKIRQQEWVVPENALDNISKVEFSTESTKNKNKDKKWPKTTPSKGIGESLGAPRIGKAKLSPSSSSPQPSNLDKSKEPEPGDRSADDSWGDFDENLEKIDDLLGDLTGLEPENEQYRLVESLPEIVNLINDFDENIRLLSKDVLALKKTSDDSVIGLLKGDIAEKCDQLRKLESEIGRISKQYKYVNQFIDGTLKYASNKKFSSYEGMVEFHLDDIAEGKFDDRFYQYFENNNRVKVNFLNILLLDEFNKDWASVTKEQGPNSFNLLISDYANKLQRVFPNHIFPEELKEKLELYSEALFWEDDAVAERREAKRELPILTKVIAAYLRAANDRGLFNDIKLGTDDAGKFSIAIDVDQSFRPDVSILKDYLERTKAVSSLKQAPKQVVPPPAAPPLQQPVQAIPQQPAQDIGDAAQGFDLDDEGIFSKLDAALTGISADLASVAGSVSQSLSDSFGGFVQSIIGQPAVQAIPVPPPPPLQQQAADYLYSRDKVYGYYEKLLNEISKGVNDELNYFEKNKKKYKEIMHRYSDGVVIQYERDVVEGKVVIYKDSRFHLTTVEFIVDDAYKHAAVFGTDGRLVVKILEDENNSYDYVKVDDFIDRAILLYDAAIKYIEDNNTLTQLQKGCITNQLHYNKNKFIAKIPDEFKFDARETRNNNSEFSSVVSSFEKAMQFQLGLIEKVIMPELKSKNPDINTKKLHSDLKQAEIDYIREKGRPNVIKFGAIEGREFFSAQLTVGDQTIPSSDRTGKHTTKLSNHVNDISGVVADDGQLKINTILGGHSSYPPIANEDSLERRYIAYQALKEKISSIVADMIAADPNFDPNKTVTLPLSLVTLLTPLKEKHIEDAIRGKAESEHRQLADTNFIFEIMSHQQQPITIDVNGALIKVKIDLNHMNYPVNINKALHNLTADEMQSRVNAKGFLKFRDAVVTQAFKLKRVVGRKNILDQSLNDLADNLTDYYRYNNVDQELKDSLRHYKDQLNRLVIAKKIKVNKAYTDIYTAMEKYSKAKESYQSAIARNDGDEAKKQLLIKSGQRDAYLDLKDDLAVDLADVRQCYKDIDKAARNIFKANKNAHKQLIKDIEGELNKNPSKEIRTALLGHLAFLKAEQIHHEQLYKEPEYAYLFQVMFSLANDNLGASIDLTCKSREDRCGFFCIMLLALDAYCEINNKYPDFNNPGDMVSFKGLFAHKAFELSVAMGNTKHNSKSRGLQIDSAFTLPGFNTEAGKQMAVLAKGVFKTQPEFVAALSKAAHNFMGLFGGSDRDEWVDDPELKKLLRDSRDAFDDRFKYSINANELLTYYSDHPPLGQTVAEYAAAKLSFLPKNNAGEYHPGYDNFFGDCLQREIRVAGLQHFGFSVYSSPSLSELHDQTFQTLIHDDVVMGQLSELLGVDGDTLERIMAASSQTMAGFIRGALSEAALLSLNNLDVKYNLHVTTDADSRYVNVFSKDGEVYLNVEYGKIKLMFDPYHADWEVLDCPARAVFKLNSDKLQPAYELVSVESDKQCIIDAAYGKTIQLSELAKEFLPQEKGLIKELEAQEVEISRQVAAKNQAAPPAAISSFENITYFGDSAEICNKTGEKTAQEIAKEKIKGYLGQAMDAKPNLSLQGRGAKPFKDDQARLIMHTLQDKENKKEIHTASVQSYDEKNKTLRADLGVKELSAFKNLKRTKPSGLFPKVSIPNELHFEYALAIIMTAVKTDESKDNLLASGGKFDMNYPVKEVREAARNIGQLLNLNLKCHPPMKNATAEELEFTCQKLLGEWAQKNDMIKRIVKDTSFQNRLRGPRSLSPNLTAGG